MRRMMDINFIGTFYAARAALPVFRAQGSGHLIIVSSIVGKRGVPLMGAYTATKFAQVGARRVAARRSSREPTSTSARVFPVSTTTEFRDVMARDNGHQVSGLGPQQPVDDVARAIVQCIRRPSPRSIRTAASRGLPILNAIAPAFTDRADAQVRPAPGRRDGAARSQPLARAMSIETARAIAHLVHEHGGRALVVGGWVRDRLLGRPAKDVDLEVFGLPAARLHALLETLRPRQGRRRELHGLQARRRRRVAAAARVEDRPRPSRRSRSTGDPDMSIEDGRAPARLHRQRDLVGSADRRLPRSVRRPRAISRAPPAARRRSARRSATTACACCARCSSPRASTSTLDAGHAALCRRIPLDDLPAERIWGEIEKLLLLAGRPSIGFALALDLGVVDRLFPELQALVGCPQEPEWHPEGDVWVHTLQVIDEARRRIDDLDRAAAARR